MRRTAPARALLLCLTFCSAIVCHAAPATAAVKDEWTSVRSPNFTLVGNASEREIRKVAARLEQFRDVFTRLFPKVNFKTPVPTTVVVFKNDSSYKPYKPLYNGKPANVSGYFQPGEDVNYITLTATTGADNPFRVIFHEYIHLLLNNNLQAVPAWFNEGLAEYYSTFELSDDRKALLGRAIANHVLLLRQRFIPLRTLLAVDHSSELYNEREKQSIFYAESWALVHYLVLGNEGKRASQVSQAIARINAGATSEDAFRQSFGVELDQLEKELKEYVRRNTYPAQTAISDEKIRIDEASMQSAPITEAQALAYLGDLLLHINRPDDAAARLDQALALEPANGTAHAALGMTRLRQRRLADAQKHLERAVAADDKNGYVRYHHAFVLSREGMNESNTVLQYQPERAERMRSELRKAIELKPDYPESYDLLAFVNLVTNTDIDESIKLIRKARSLAPGRERYAFTLAQLQMRKENFAAARAGLKPIAERSPDPQSRAQAQTLLARAAEIERQLADYKASRANFERKQSEALRGDGAGVVVTTDKPLSEEEERRLVDRAQLEAVREALRKPAAGERRVQGKLLRIDCASATDIVYTIQTADGVLKLRSAGFEPVIFNVFAPGIDGQIACGERSKRDTVVIVFRPEPNAKTKTDGGMVAVEFVAPDFTLEG